MAARLRGALVVELAASELDAARRALGRAIEGGALGPGRSVSLQGDAVLFDGGLRAFGASRGRIVLSADGRASYELRVGAAEWARVAQAAGVAALSSVTTTLALHWIPTWALPFGGAVGLVWATLGIARDRRRLRRDVRALVRELPRLLSQGR